MIPTELKREVELKLTEVTSSQTTVLKSVNVSGGCINDSCRIETSSGVFFIKWNNALTYPGMFEREKDGLIALADPECIRIPKVIIQSSVKKISYLILEFIESSQRKKDFWTKFGRGLACLHKQSNNKFGWGNDNYIGSLPQHNSWRSNWVDFFIEMRLDKQSRMAYDNNLLDDNDLKLFDLLYLRLDEIIPSETPSLLHGDLWSGNFLENENGGACIVDPAVYYGNREVDLAMSHLFGGFDQEFYNSYYESFPLQHGFKQRIDIHNLYPLLVHLNLFGLSYRPGIRSILRKLG